jgi:hypothetical protein
MVKTFGVPISLVATSSLDNKNHVDMMKKRREIELLRNTPSTPQIHPTAVFRGPRDKDVLLGRGFIISDHPGNLQFRSFVKDHFDFYNTFRQNQRNGVSAQIVQILKEEGIRFLKKEKHGWVEVSDDQARLKVANVFRDLRKRRSDNSGEEKQGVKRKALSNAI